MLGRSVQFERDGRIAPVGRHADPRATVLVGTVGQLDRVLAHTIESVFRAFR